MHKKKYERNARMAKNKYITEEITNSKSNNKSIWEIVNNDLRAMPDTNDIVLIEENAKSTIQKF